MNERRLGFAPVIHQKEKVPKIPVGKEITRIDGKLVIVTAKSATEPYYGNSPYTLRQLCEIYYIEALNKIEKLYCSY